jgi:hypothetical protein
MLVPAAFIGGERDDRAPNELIRPALLGKEFPPDMPRRYEQSRDVLLIGITLAQTNPDLP